MINAIIIADSISPQNVRITSFVLTVPQIIVKELLRHRMFSFSSSSMRAIPFNKILLDTKENMFIPLAFQKHHFRMQGTEYLIEKELENAKQQWVESGLKACEEAERLYNFGVTKQLCSRIIEPYGYAKILVTATEWDNFFELRCPQYHLENVPTVNEDLSLNAKTITLVGKSKKELLKQINEINNDSYTGFKNIINKYSDLDWLYFNKGQAEIHIQALAEAMLDAMNKSIPKELKAGKYHVPFFEIEED